MNRVMYVYKYKRWARKGHMIFTKWLFMGAWGKGEKNTASYGDPGRLFLFIIFNSF